MKQKITLGDRVLKAESFRNSRLKGLCTFFLLCIKQVLIIHMCEAEGLPIKWMESWEKCETPTKWS